jgi:hypothetical protein
VSQEYKIGKIQAENVAVGKRAKAKHITRVDPKQASAQAEALDQIRKLIELLSIHANEIKSPQTAQADAESVEAALEEKIINHTRVNKLIRNITRAAGGVTAIADAIDAVRAAVGHL